MKHAARNAKIVAHFRLGMSSSDIADGMGLSAATVTHAIHDSVPEAERRAMIQKRRLTTREKKPRGPKQIIPGDREDLLNSVTLGGRNLANYP
jgi:transposase